MWCPKCRSEYRDGFAVCAECGSPLVEVLPAAPAPEPVFLTETEGDEAWILPELLHRAGIPCYLYRGNGLFEPMTPDGTVPGRLYVDERHLESARRCMSLLNEPPREMGEEELMDAYEDYMEEEAPEEGPSDDEGGAIWKVFLLMGILLFGGLLYLLFSR